ncbi:MAG: PilN domain-containing protein [Candidatus Aceula meridiana]|nr:PilN domain-containing protein [Candidatus Aceula meridiana]
MININLVPESLQKKKKSQFFKTILRDIPLEIVIGAAGGILVLLVIMHILLQGIISVRFISHARLSGQWASIAEKKGEVDAILQELQDLRKKINDIEQVTVEKRISWAEKLNCISDKIPSGVWLQRVSLASDIFLIEGSAVSRRQDEMISVGNFSSNLKKEKDFMKGLDDIEVSSIQRRMVNIIEVADFVISVKLEDEGSDE